MNYSSHRRALVCFSNYMVAFKMDLALKMGFWVIIEGEIARHAMS